MSGANAQFINWVNLKNDKGDPREQIRRATCDLAPGSLVKVWARNVAPVPFAVPFLNAADFAWYRQDLRWSFDSDNAQVLRAWRELHRELVEFNK